MAQGRRCLSTSAEDIANLWYNTPIFRNAEEKRVIEKMNVLSVGWMERLRRGMTVALMCRNHVMMALLRRAAANISAASLTPFESMSIFLPFLAV